MNDKREALLEFLRTRGVPTLGFAEDVVPTSQAAWRYTSRMDVTLLDEIPRDDIRRLDDVFCRSAEKLAIFGKGPALLSVSGFGCPWVRVEIAGPERLVEQICVYVDEPRFIIASETAEIILAVDAQEWNFLLIAAQWTDEHLFAPITSADLAKR